MSSTSSTFSIPAPVPSENARPAPAVDVQWLSYAYRRTLALRDVNFVVERQSIHGFVGPNGAGKTTALKVLATLLRPARGRVTVFGSDLVRDYKKIREKIGFMPDHFSLYRQMTVFEYLDFFAAAYGMDLARRNKVIGDVLTLTDMAGRRDDLIRSLSRGMQQRLSLARVLVHDPDLLLLDEPASGLDPRARIELMEILKELRRMGKTIFISSHILSELEDLCDSFTIIDRGVVRYSGTKESLLMRDGELQSYVITLARPDPVVEGALRKLDGVASVAMREDKACYNVAVNREQVSGNALLNALLATDAEVESFQKETAGINQAFMDLTEPGVPS